MAETSTIFGFMKYVSATDILSDFKKTVDSHFVNSLEQVYGLVFLISLFQMNGNCNVDCFFLWRWNERSNEWSNTTFNDYRFCLHN